MQNLYLCSDNQAHVAALLSRLSDELNYHRYDPFRGVPGPAYARALRLFVAPAQAGWVRVLGEWTEPDFAGLVSHHAACLYLDIEGDQLAFFEDGQVVTELVAALRPHLSQSEAALRAALQTPDTLRSPTDDDAAEGIPLDALPQDVQAMAQKLQPKHITRLFNRVLRQIGGMDDAAARDLLASRQVSSRIQAVMACLTIPDPYWHTPDFITLRDAYSLHLRRQRNPNAPLYPGDAEAMAAVPDALSYTPVYGGK